MIAASGRRSLLLPALSALALFVLLVGLGIWQINRKAWKESLIDTLNHQLAAAPIDLPPRDKWPDWTPDNSEFTRVRLHVDFAKVGDALVFTSGSSIRDDVTGTGYFVFTPARLLGGGQVVINRGFAPTRSYPAAAGPQDIIGFLRFPEAASWFAKAHDSAGEIWTVRDQLAMARVRGWGDVAPFYIEQEAPVPPGGLPHPAPLKPQLRNDHLQYAITWFGFAAVLLVMFTIWVFRRRGDTP